jgi:cell division GTPase FtsZ
MEEGFEEINDNIAQRLGLLFASGVIDAVDEVAESVVDSSEIINTLRPGGMAVLGYASAAASEDAGENVNAITSTTRNALLTGTSVPNVVQAETGLLVVAGQPERISRKGVERARSWVEEETGSMEVRGGDFPLDSERIATLVLLGGVERSNRINEFMERAREAHESKAEQSADATETFASDELDDLF